MLFDWDFDDDVGSGDRLKWLKEHNVHYVIKISSAQRKNLPEGWLVNKVMIEIHDPESAFLYKLTWG